MVILRAATEADLPDCAGIMRRAWAAALPDIPRRTTLADLRRETTGETITLAVRAGATVAFMSVWPPDDFIHHLYVDPSAQRTGAGRALVLFAIAQSPRPPALKCLVANRNALAFYRALGFTEDGESGRDEFGLWVRLVGPGGNRVVSGQSTRQ